MEKEQSKGIVLKNQIKKQRQVSFPYYLISSIYSHQSDFHFIVVVDYALQSTVLSIYPFRKDMSRLPTCTITINDILTKKAVSVLHVNRLIYKTHSHGVTILEGSFILGHRSGQIAVIQYKDKECKISQRMNKTLKHEGLLSRTSSFIFGGEDSYTPFFKEPIKQLQINPTLSDWRFTYQVGNTIMLMRDFLQSNEAIFFKQYQANKAQAYNFQNQPNTVATKGSLSMYGNKDYYSLRDISKNIALISFNNEVSSYNFMDLDKKQLAVALNVKQTILILDTTKFLLKRQLKTQMSIRRLNYFTDNHKGYLVIMFYDNYVIIYDIKDERYCKLVGHRSFIANIGFDQIEKMIVTAGMDHRICLCRINAIKETYWENATIMGNQTKIQDSDCPQMRFPDIYSLGEYNNVRTNTHSYGFAQFTMFNHHYCLPTYDAKLMIYKYA